MIIKSADHESTLSLSNQIKRLHPRVTVITPTYNRAGLIASTIKSVLAQNYTDYIYIILDDGSTDDTRRVVQEVIKNNKNCFYLYHSNVGEAQTVNMGWRLCRGEYFLQVNSDDTIEPDLLNEMVAALDNNPDCVVAYPDFYVIDQKDKIIEDFKNFDWDLTSALSAFSCYAAAPGALIRKNAFRQLDTIKDSSYKYINDVKMLWNMALKGNFVHIPKTLASWRSHAESISSDRYKSIGEVITWADEYFSQPNLPKEVRVAERKCRQTIDDYCLRLLENSDAETVVVNFAKYLREKYGALVKENDLLSSRIESTQLRNKELEQRVRQLEYKMARLEQSLSWKVTRPLREVSGHLKTLLGKGHPR